MRVVVGGLHGLSGAVVSEHVFDALVSTLRIRGTDVSYFPDTPAGNERFAYFKKVCTLDSDPAHLPLDHSQRNRPPPPPRPSHAPTPLNPRNPHPHLTTPPPTAGGVNRGPGRRGRGVVL